MFLEGMMRGGDSNMIQTSVHSEKGVGGLLKNLLAGLI